MAGTLSQMEQDDLATEGEGTQRIYIRDDERMRHRCATH